MITKNRGQGVQPTEAIQLIAKFYDFAGNLTDLDSFPTISIIQPDGNVIFSPTSAGVYRLSLGIYAFLYEVPYTTNAGIYIDFWKGLLNGFALQAEFNFVVEVGQQQTLPTDGYEYLGQDVGFDFSQAAIHNINQLVKGLKARLNSSGKAATKDEFGNTIFQDCDIYTTDQLITFLVTALSAFNMVPTFTEFTFEDSEIIRVFYAVIMQHAVLSAFAAKSLIEAGREFAITDNGISWSPPGVSEKLMNQYTAELGNWDANVRLIKQNCKPSPRGISCYAPLGSPRLRILRTLKSRQIM